MTNITKQAPKQNKNKAHLNIEMVKAIKHQSLDFWFSISSSLSLSELSSDSTLSVSELEEVSLVIITGL